jgi:outer membrane protein insertion porin family
MISAIRSERRRRSETIVIEKSGKFVFASEGLVAGCVDGIRGVQDVVHSWSRNLLTNLASNGLHFAQHRPPCCTAQTPAFASLSTSTSGEPVAMMPSKDRSRKAALTEADLEAKSSTEQDGPGNAASSGSGNSGSPSVPSPASSHPSSTQPPEESEERILISEVDVSGCDGELRTAVLSALTTRPNFAYTVKEVQEDMQRVFDTGYFSSCRPRAEDTRDGVRLTVEVLPNPALRGVVAKGACRLPQRVIQDAFSGMAGKTLNYNALTSAVARLNSWYEENGVLGQVTDVELGAGDVAQVRLAEANVNRITLKYVDPKTGESREEGRTAPDVILRQLTTRPGHVYNLNRAKADIEAVYSMGLFEDVSIRPSPAEGSTVESPRVDLTLEVKERKKTGGLAAGGGISAAGATESAMPGFLGTVTYSQRNLFGRGQRLVAAAEVGQVDSTFRVAHTDPWVRGDAYRTSRTLSAQSTKTSAAPVHGRAQDDEDAAALGVEGQGQGGDGVFVSRTVSSIEYGRPLGTGWQGSLGLSWQRAKCVDEAGRELMQDVYGGPLMVNRSGRGHDTMSLGTIRVAYK